jgi:catechol 2,3-dioxygenase-like lactoylglutathione lyase family enzyme
MWRGETSMERPEFKFKSLDHLAMKVRDLEKFFDFYVGLLGWRLNDGKSNSEFFGRPNRFVSCTDRHHTINMFEFRPKDGSCDPPVVNTQDNDEYGIMHFAFEVENKEAFDAWEKFLRSKGVEFVYGPLLHSLNHPEGDK